MEIRRYQWVGLLAGVPLFSGAWLSALYQTSWWGVFGLIFTAWGLYVANQVERRADNTTQAKRGIVAGLLAGVVARAIGYIAALMGGVSMTVAWQDARDVFRIVLAGDWVASLSLILVVGGLGVLMAVLEPDAAKSVKTKGKRG
ncbi:hypothetical protein KA093_01250 [Candidatus Saccharibacteria bacterium]|nr:hypothetical protein [Candidatus Saccharibacteria bacterium]